MNITYTILLYKKHLLNLFEKALVVNLNKKLSFDLSLISTLKAHYNLHLFLYSNFNSQFLQLIEYTSADSFVNFFNYRFTLYSFLLSPIYNTRFLILVPVLEKKIIPSLSKIFSSSLWLEREIWDMFGIFFAGNPDLRRILTNYGFEGFPLRKDFPVTGYKQIFYNEVTQSLIEEHLELTQEMRVYDKKF